MLCSGHLTAYRLKFLTYYIHMNKQRHMKKITHNWFIMKEVNNPVRCTLILSPAASSLTRVENASFGADKILIEMEEFALQPHYGMWRSMHRASRLISVLPHHIHKYSTISQVQHRESCEAYMNLCNCKVIYTGTGKGIILNIWQDTSKGLSSSLLNSRF